MSIIFFGTPEFAVPSLKALVESGEEIALVVAQPDKVSGRGHKLTMPPVKTAALDAGLRVIQPSTIKDETFIGEIAALDPEFIVVVAYGKILSRSLLEIPRRGCINVHASLLPKYRGAAPISWAIIRGEMRTGVTTMLMDEGLDTGPVLLMKETDVSLEDTTATLGERLSKMGASLLMETLNGIRAGAVTPVPQRGEPSYAPPLRKEDGLIDWSKSARELFNFVRGMQPWPVAYCHMGGETLRIFRTEPLPGRGSPGVVERIGPDGIVVGTGEGLLSILELQPQAKKRMAAVAFIQGRRLTEGMSVR